MGLRLKGFHTLSILTPKPLTLKTLHHDTGVEIPRRGPTFANRRCASSFGPSTHKALRPHGGNAFPGRLSRIIPQGKHRTRPWCSELTLSWLRVETGQGNRQALPTPQTQTKLAPRSIVDG